MQAYTDKTHVLSVDSHTPTRRFNRFFTECIGSCHAYLTLREDFREHVRQVQREIGFKRIRCHGIFHDLVGIYHSETAGLANSSAAKAATYNFQNLNKIYDFFLSQGLQPYVELSFMPKALASSNAEIFRYRANISPPNDFEQWNQLIDAFVRHCIGRYGLEEVQQWYFEVWNEPDLQNVFWSGDQHDYFELYAHTVRTIRAVDAELKVGGPSTSKNLWIEEFLSYCADNQLPVDFISTHHYCADAALETGTDVFNIDWRGQAAMRSDARAAACKIDASQHTAAELHYTEWNVSPCHEDSFGKDSEFNATFILHTLKQQDGVVNAYSYWCLSDIFEESGPGLQPFSGKYGLLNIDGVKKPSFHAFKFLAQLYDTVLHTEHTSTWITSADESTFRVLSWNFCEPTETDFNGGDYKLDSVEVEEEIRLENLQGEFQVTAHKVGRSDGNAYRAWQAMGSPQYPSEKQLQRLHHSAEPTKIADNRSATDGALVLQHTLQANDFVFYDISRIGKV